METTGSPPASGTAEIAGTIQGALGSGAVVDQNIFGPLPEFHGPVRAFYAKGTLKGSLEGTGVLNADGTISFAGTGEISKGTGKYKGARGKFTFVGSSPFAGSPVQSFDITGTIKY